MKITLNLLPQEQKTARARQRFFALALQQELYVIIIILIFFLGLVSMHIILKTEGDLLQEQLDTANNHLYQEQVQKAYALFATTNDEMRDVFVINDHHIVWTELLRAISAQVHRDIRVDALHIRNGQLKMIAVAKTRNDAVLLKEKLGEIRIGEVRCLEEITIPQEDLAAAQDAEFTLTATINKTCVMQGEKALTQTTEDIEQAQSAQQGGKAQPDHAS